nr:hypothetical protein [Tanacetum cinerariifolium]
IPCFTKRFIKTLLKIGDFIMKIGCFGRRKELVDEFKIKIIPSENRSRGFFPQPNPGFTFEGKWKKHKLNRRIRNVRELQGRSDLVEISNMSMRVFFVMSKELLVLNNSKETMLELKIISSGCWSILPDVAELKDMAKALLLDKKSQNQSPAIVKAVKESCVTCGGDHSYRNCPATDGNVYRDNIKNSFLKPPQLTTTKEIPAIVLR